MEVLQVQNLAMGFNKPLFGRVNLRAQKGDKIGLIGDNGSGKSTFLKMLGGLDVVEEGQIIWGKDLKIGYLNQEIYGEVDMVSGGEKKILKICELFYSDYDVVLLDEPDNHLDLDHKLWFEQLVKDFPGLVIIISHDRNLLKNSVNKIWFLEELKITEYPFAYDKFRDIYEGNMAARLHLWQTQEKERQRLEDLVKMYKQRVQSSTKFSGLLSSTIKRYDKFVGQMIEKPPEAKNLKLNIKNEKQPKRKTAILIKDVYKSYGNNQILKGVNLHVFCGERIAIHAPNGSGKSTLLNSIAGKIKDFDGEIKIGLGLKIGYYAQEHLQALDEDSTLLDELQKSDPVDFYSGKGFLKKFLFTDEQINNPVRFLSGGQKSRLQLAKFLSTNPDILVLDEPTNHLDLRTVLSLENFLKEYTGTLILVSHDRDLVHNVVDKTYRLVDGKLQEVYELADE